MILVKHLYAAMWKLGDAFGTSVAAAALSADQPLMGLLYFILFNKAKPYVHRQATCFHPAVLLRSAGGISRGAVLVGLRKRLGA